MGAPIIAGLQTGQNVASLFGTPVGSNEAVYGEIGKPLGVGIMTVSSLASIGSALHVASLASLSSPLVAISIAWVEAVFTLVTKIFHGADPVQVPASQVEQAFELGGLFLHYLTYNGYLTKAEGAAAAAAILKAGNNYFAAILDPQKGLPAALKDPRPFKAGQANMQKVLGDDAVLEATQPETAPGGKPLPFDQAAAHAIYEKAVSITGKAWYLDSITAGENLADGYMTFIRQSSAAAESSVQAVSAPGASPVATSTKNKLFAGLGIGAAVLAWAIL